MQLYNFFILYVQFVYINNNILCTKYKYVFFTSCVQQYLVYVRNNVMCAKYMCAIISCMQCIYLFFKFLNMRDNCLYAIALLAIGNVDKQSCRQNVVGKRNC